MMNMIPLKHFNIIPREEKMIAVVENVKKIKINYTDSINKKQGH